MRPAWLAYAFKREILRSRGVVILLLGIMLLLIPWVLSMHYDFYALYPLDSTQYTWLDTEVSLYSLGWRWSETPDAEFTEGGFVFGMHRATAPKRYTLYPGRSFVWEWHPRSDPEDTSCFPDSSDFELAFPQWLPPSLLLAPLGLLVRKHARRLLHVNALGCCASCGYDVRGTPERCPECGTPPAEPKSMVGAAP